MSSHGRAGSGSLTDSWHSRCTAVAREAEHYRTVGFRERSPANISVESSGFEHLILAQLWERRGQRARAVSAVRLNWAGFGLSGWNQAMTAREEGRLAALVGDTTGAICAYRRYLDFRRDAEPALIPQRDSVRAELARLVQH